MTSGAPTGRPEGGKDGAVPPSGPLQIAFG